MHRITSNLCHESLSLSVFQLLWWLSVTISIMLSLTLISLFKNTNFIFNLWSEESWWVDEKPGSCAMIPHIPNSLLSFNPHSWVVSTFSFFVCLFVSFGSFWEQSCYVAQVGLNFFYVVQAELSCFTKVTGRLLSTSDLCFGSQDVGFSI